MFKSMANKQKVVQDLFILMVQKFPFQILDNKKATKVLDFNLDATFVTGYISQLYKNQQRE